MGIFDSKSPEEKQQEYANKQAEREVREAGKRQAAWLQSPEGRAATAKEGGEGFFEIELELGTSRRNVAFGTSDTGSYNRSSYTDVLSAIESHGWSLVQVGYYFMPTGETSREKFLASGQNVAINGKSMGVYLFRNVTKVQ